MSSNDIKTLAIDIGGTGIKMMVLNSSGKAITEKGKLKTPRPATPEAMLAVMQQIAKDQGEFDRISAGFPGVVHKGVVKTSPNLDPSWHDVNLEKELENKLGKPARVANDADVQGLGDISGSGVELVITLGTGMGSALFVNGQLVPNLEFGHHPLKNKNTYEDLLSHKALDKNGAEKWNKNLDIAVDTLSRIFNYDTLYIGGGNTKYIQVELASNIKITENVAGILGGIKLWDLK